MSGVVKKRKSFRRKKAEVLEDGGLTLQFLSVLLP